MKKLNKLSIYLMIAMIIYLGGIKNVSAQEENDQWPIYVVQSGDILSSIANRFKVSIESIIKENNIINANQLFVGTEIKIPGVTWATGLLTDSEISLGETYVGIKRAFGYSDNTMIHLGNIISPNQLSVGRSFLYASNQGEHLNQERIALGKNQSMLEVAIRTNQNPWEIIGENELLGNWNFIPSDILHIPNTVGQGPSGVPSVLQLMEIGKGDFVQGKTNTIRIATDFDNLEISGQLMGNLIAFNKDDIGNYYLLLGPHVLAKPGLYPLSIAGKDSNGAQFSFSQMVTVKDGGYGSENITVDPALLDQNLADAEAKFLQTIISNISADKLWQGFFLPPTIYYDNINSLFGTRRSFNRSAYDYYHGGLDFGGGTGVEIAASANGVVVFSSSVEIRGNLTIIDHGWGIYSGYSHQSEIRVNVGDEVFAGQVIGLVGNTGRSSGAHLHWEIWSAGLQVDPMDWLLQEFP